MSRILTAVFATLLSVSNAFAQPVINYDVSWDDPASHYFHISMEVGDLTTQTLDVQMPAWRPGRYILQDYAKYIIDVEASDLQGNELPIEKIDKHTWRVVTMGNEVVKVSYKTFANLLDAGESYLDEGEAYLNPISILMNVPGRLQEEVGLRLMRPEGWNVVSALEYDSSARTLAAVDYHELVDSPILSSPDFDLISFDVAGKNINIAIQGDWDYDEKRLIKDHKAMTEAQMSLMGSLPFESYLFLYHVLDKPFGHGVEHKNSTAIVIGPGSNVKMPDSDKLASGSYASLLAVASHELFHAWNVERIRPEVMYPTDYSKEQYTSQMWIFEGITDYYGDVAMFKAGLRSEDGFLTGLAKTIRSFENNPARKVTSIAMTSYDSWTKQGRAPRGTYYSFYGAGKAIGTILDLDVRARTNSEKSLDDVFRYLFAECPMKDRGLPENGFKAALEHITGSSYDDFFSDHIYGKEDVEWDKYLEGAGLEIKEDTDPNPSSWMKVFISDLTFLGLHPEGPAAQAGIKSGDTLTKVGDAPVTSGEDLEEAFSKFSEGDNVKVVVTRDGEEVSAEIIVGAPVMLPKLHPVSNASDEQSAVLRSWLGK